MKKTLACLCLAALPLAAGEPTVNGTVVNDLIVLAEGDGWSAAYTRDLQKGEAAPELSLNAGGIKKHPQHPHIAGYNGDVTMKIIAPGPVTDIAFTAAVTNFADGKKDRKAVLSYSLDGVNYITLAEKEFGDVTLEGAAKPATNRGILWLRFARVLDADDANGRSGFVLLRNLSFKLKGAPPPAAADDDGAAPAAADNPYALAKQVPTGVFWPWERTQPNADHAGMELWEFVEHTMVTLKNLNCDTLWFVNIGPGDNARRILLLAEKHGMKVLLNTALLDQYYHGFRSFDLIAEQANKTVNLVGDCPALLGYVLKDEPLLASLAHCSFFYREMKRADPKRDSLAVVMNRQSQSFIEESDLPVICSDIYYFGHDKSTNIPNPRPTSQREFALAVDGLNRAAARHGKTHWLMPQMFGDIWGRHYRVGDKLRVEPGSYLHWRMPTDSETRWQIWEGTRLGSNGMLFYVLYPPIPLWEKPGDNVDPESREGKRLASMDKNAASAAGWGHQELTREVVDVDAGEGVLQPGGEPTPQALAMGECFAALRKNADWIAKRRRAPFPSFFAEDAKTGVASYEVAGDAERMYGVVVNHDLDNRRDITLRLPPHMTRLVNLNNDADVALEKIDDNFQRARINLDAGDGVLLRAEFAGGRPGMLLCRETFWQYSYHKVKLAKEGVEIMRFGNYAIQPYFALRRTAAGAEPAFSLENLANPATANNTYAMNINLKKRQGVLYAQLTGRLEGVKLNAVTGAAQGEETNVSHLAEGNLAAGATAAGGQGMLIQDGQQAYPGVLPLGTTRLDAYIDNTSARVESLTLWFVPDP